jgi:hypothetical protein
MGSSVEKRTEMAARAMSVQRRGLEREREVLREVVTAVDEAMGFSWEMEDAGPVLR